MANFQIAPLLAPQLCVKDQPHFARVLRRGISHECLKYEEDVLSREQVVPCDLYVYSRSYLLLGNPGKLFFHPKIALCDGLGSSAALCLFFYYYHCLLLGKYTFAHGLYSDLF